MTDTRLNFLLAFAVLCAVCVCVCSAITIDAVIDRDAALTSERAARLELQELRATMAAQGLGELF